MQLLHGLMLMCIVLPTALLSGFFCCLATTAVIVLSMSDGSSLCVRFDAELPDGMDCRSEVVLTESFFCLISSRTTESL